MSREEKITKGLVISVTDYKDNDQIINVLSENSEYLSFYAQGVKKITSKNANALQLFSFSEIQYFQTRGKLLRIKTAKSINNYFFEVKDYDKVVILSMMLEVINDITQLAEDNYQWFEFTINSLKNINKYNEYLLMTKFLIEIMKTQGIELEVDHCVVCLNTKVNYISVADGGFICHNCSENRHLETYDLEVLKLFRLLNKNIELDKITHINNQENIKAVLKIIYQFYNEYSGLSIKKFEEIIN